MMLSGSLAPAPRTIAAVGRIELREALSTPRQRHSSAERYAQAVHRDPGREAQGSLDQPNERTSALKRALGRRVGHSPWQEVGVFKNILVFVGRVRVCLTW